MKRKILSIALVIIALSTLAYGTYAYFTTSDETSNIITAGNIGLALRDRPTDEVQSRLEGLETILPGTVVNKPVYVENTKENPLYARVKLDKKLSPILNAKSSLDMGQIQLNINTKDWTYSDKDGYYYYNTVLVKGEKSKPLFTTISFGKDMGNEYMKAKLEIKIYAQAVQSKNNGDTVFKAAGWPASEV